MKIEMQVLDQLIDKYERSRHYFEEPSLKRVLLSAREIKLYQSNLYSDKKAVHEALETLRDKGLIDFQWMKFEEGNLLDKVFLNLERLESCYSELGRKPLWVQIQEAKSDLEELDCHLVWVRMYVTDMIAYLDAERRFHRLLPQEADKRRQLLAVLKGVGEISELTERLFSIRFLGDSKVFEKAVRSRLTTILKVYLDPEMEEDQLLATVGIVRNYDELLLKGPISVLVDGMWLDLGGFAYGTSLNSETIRHIEKVEVRGSRVLTIENKAVYYERIKSAAADEIVLYLGGFFGKYTRVFIEKLRDGADKLSYQHWGDIDLGGFMIYDALKRILVERLEPLHMNLETFERHKVQTMTFSDEYGTRLCKYLERHPESEFCEVIGYMLAHKLRLEQEALII